MYDANPFIKVTLATEDHIGSQSQPSACIEWNMPCVVKALHVMYSNSVYMIPYEIDTPSVEGYVYIFHGVYGFQLE